jgi:hypothetical protein
MQKENAVMHGLAADYFGKLASKLAEAPDPMI